MARTSRKKRNEGVPQGVVRARVDRARGSGSPNPHLRRSVASFLREEGLFEEASARAIKEVLVFQIQNAMKREGLAKVDMARRMATSRAALDRLLDPENGSVTLATLFRAASALGSELKVELKKRRNPRAAGRRRA